MGKMEKLARRMMYDEFAQAVVGLIGKKKMWDRYLPAERELAGLFGVSRETVRRGLRVLEERGVIVREHGRGNRVAARRKRGRSVREKRLIVASVHAEGGGGYTGEIISGLTAAAGQGGLLLAFRNLVTPAMRQQLFEELAGGPAYGLLLLGTTDHELVAEVLRAWNGPTVLVDHYFEDLPVTGVIDDSEGGARQAVEHLLSAGHRRIGYVDVSRREMNPWRYMGYAGGLLSAGIELDASLVVPAFSSFESGRQAGELLLGMTDAPTAVMAFDDTRAWGVWRAAEARGLRVGTDLALVGYGDTAARAGFPEELSSVRFKSRDVGRVAIEKIADLARGKAKPGELVKIPTELVVRASSKEARKSTQKA